MAPVKLRKPAQPWWLRTLLACYEWAASLQAAVILLALTAGVLAWATFVEKWYGAEAVSFGIYRAWWFMLLVGLLGMNVLCATLIRWPWKKHQTGFVITHTGIVVLLAGCLLQQGWGIQGQMILHEGQASNLVYEDQKVFRLEIVQHQASGAQPVVHRVEVPFRSGPFHWADYQRLPFFPWRMVPRDQGQIYHEDGITLEVLDYYADSQRLVVPRVVLGLRRVGGEDWELEQMFPSEGLLTLTVAPPSGPHAAQRPFGVGDRQNMPWGPPVVFWLSGSQAECQAFLQTRPEAPVGTLGQVVLWHQGKVYRFPIEQLQKETEHPLGGSGLRVRLREYVERMRAVDLEVQPADRVSSSGPVRMLLFSQNPSHNRQAEALGVYGSFWQEPPSVPEPLAGIRRVELLRWAACLRLDLLQGPDGALYYRQWHAPRVVSVGRWPGLADQHPSDQFGRQPPWPAQNTQKDSELGKPYPVEHLRPLRVFEHTPLETEVRVVEFRPSPGPAILYQPKPLEGAGSGRLRQPRAKIRLTLQDTFATRPSTHLSVPPQKQPPSEGSPSANSGEFWVPLGGPQFADEEAVVSCGHRRVRVQLDYRKQALGMSIYLRDFTRKVDPGSPHDAHYSSLVDVWEGKEKPTVRQEKVLITMNQPLTAKDPATGRTYRFYQSSFAYLGKPGDPEFDQWFQHRAFRSGLEGITWPDPEASPTSASAGPSPGASGQEPIPENLYRSILSVNYDPGRGLKYAGSFLIVLGIAVMYLMRAYIFAPRSARPIARKALVGLAAIGWLLLGAGPACADQLDWSCWRRLPVFAGGRLMPLDSFARSVVEEICGRTHPRLGLADSLPGEDLHRPEYAQARQLFPDGKARTWPYYELVFSWLVEPHRWERVPFLIAQHHQLREELLGLPRQDPSGQPIRYVSPWQLEHAEPFWRWHAEIRRRRLDAEAAGQPFQPTGLDRKAWQLLEAYTAWRELVFSAEALSLPHSLFRNRLSELDQLWQATVQAIEQALEMAQAHQQSRPPQQPPSLRHANNPPPTEAYSQFQQALQALQGLVEQKPIDRPHMEQHARRLRESAQQLADWFEGFYHSLRQSSPPMPPETWQQMQGHWMALVSRTRDLHRLAWEVQAALFDDSPVAGASDQMVRLVPSLNPFALEEARTPEENPQPWLTWQALMQASLTDTLADYPSAEIQAVRKAFHQAAQAYQDRQAADRPARFAAAMRQLADALDQLGQAINQRRAKLPVRKLDQAAFLATQYPPPGATNLEVHYNQLDPFRAAWIAYLAAVVGFALAFGRIRTGMFWTGMVLSAIAQFFILYGLALRYAITGWVPVTNMFETVVFVALTVGLMGWLLALWPMLGPGFRLAWQLTAWPIPTPRSSQSAPKSPQTPQNPLPHQPPAQADAPVGLAGSLPPEQGAGLTRHGPTSPDAEGHSPQEACSGSNSPAEDKPTGWSDRALLRWRWILAPVRLALMGVVFYALTQVHYGEAGGYTVVSLLPRLDRGGALGANDLVAWLVGLAFLLVSMWYAPRALLALLASLGATPLFWRRQPLHHAYQQVLGRKPYAFSGALMGLLGALLAYYAPPSVLDKSIGPLRPVLRDNFWLTAHVLTITASYGAGALALALGNLALFHYLFGRYRPVLPRHTPAAQQPTAAAPPEHSPGPAAEGQPAASESVGAENVRLGWEPPACAALAHYIYRCMQVAVLLLAAGTILGALWADVAWGRFWGWDAKEVWSLISLLVYMVVLHGRYIGWFGHFGMAAFSVLGATSILMAWYGVNYVLDVGLHTYGRGTGGLGVVLSLVGANWLFLAAAAARYWYQTKLSSSTNP